MGLEEGSRATLSVAGKSIRCGDGKFVAFAARIPAIAGPLDFSAKLAISRALRELRAAGINTVILPARIADAVAGIAGHAGLYAIVEIALAADELASAAGLRRALARTNHTVRVIRDYRALAGYLIAYSSRLENGVATIGDVPVRGLRAIAAAIRAADHDRLIALRDERGGPPAPVAADLIVAPLEVRTAAAAREAIFALHSAAGPRPIVVEFAEANSAVADLAARAIALGAAGVSFASGAPIEIAGIVERFSRCRRDRVASADGPPPRVGDTSDVSVIVAIGARRTSAPLVLESLRALERPARETIVAATDAAASVALNQAVASARVEWLAFLDADCAVADDWLALLMGEIDERGLDGAAGPMFTRDADGAIRSAAACGGAAGAGCNFVVRRGAFRAVGGFDPIFARAAGASDLIARLKSAGFHIGFHPGAVATRSGESGIRARIRRQWAVGRAEAILARRHADDRDAALWTCDALAADLGAPCEVPGRARRPLRIVAHATLTIIPALIRAAARGWTRLTLDERSPLLPCGGDMAGRAGSAAGKIPPVRGFVGAGNPRSGPLRIEPSPTPHPVHPAVH